MKKRQTQNQKLQERITALEESNKLLSDRLQELQKGSEEQFLASPTYCQMKERIEWLTSANKSGELHLQSKMKSLERFKITVQNLYADNKALHSHHKKNDEEYFVGLTNSAKTAKEFNKVQEQLANYVGMEEAFKILLEDRDRYIKELISKISAQNIPENQTSKYNYSSLSPDEQAEIIGHIIDKKKEMKKATFKKVGRPNRTSVEQEQLIIALHSKGKSQRQIASEMGIGLGTVNRIIKKHSSVIPK